MNQLVEKNKRPFNMQVSVINIRPQYSEQDLIKIREKIRGELYNIFKNYK